jgi:hypothetical protein
LYASGNFIVCRFSCGIPGDFIDELYKESAYTICQVERFWSKKIPYRLNAGIVCRKRDMGQMAMQDLLPIADPNIFMKLMPYSLSYGF